MDSILKYFTESNPQENSRRLTSLIIFVLLSTYAYVFFDLLIKEYCIASILLIFVIFTLIKSAIANYDILYSGNPDKNNFVRAFQVNLPSKYIMTKYNVDMKEAISLWFGVFNKWSNPQHSRHYNRKTTLSRGFECRMVYLTITSFRFMALLSLITIEIIYIINHNKFKFSIEIIDKYFINHQNLMIPIIFTIICFIVQLIFFIINYPDSKDPKGCFLRFNEINQINIDWLDKNISSIDDFKNYENKNNNNS